MIFLFLKKVNSTHNNEKEVQYCYEGDGEFEFKYVFCDTHGHHSDLLIYDIDEMCLLILECLGSLDLGVGTNFNFGSSNGTKLSSGKAHRVVFFRSKIAV